MKIHSLFPIIEGAQHSLALNEAKRLENSVKAGENSYLTAVFQIWQGSKAISFTTLAAEAAGLAPFSWVGKGVVYIAPVFLAILKSKEDLPDSFKPAIRFLHNHLSSFYQVAAVVSCLSLLIFGHSLLSVPALVILGLGFLDRSGYLPLSLRQLLHRYSDPLFIATGLIAGDLLDKIVVILSLLSWGINRYLATKNASFENFALKENLTPEKLEDFLEGGILAKINPKFIHYDPMPPIPDIDIAYFLEKFDQINWTKHLPALRKKLEKDPRFIHRHQSPLPKTDQEILLLARDFLTDFIQSVKERRILEGEPVDYDKLHNYLKIIAKHIQKSSDEVVQTDAIFRLVVEGGKYCGPGKFEVAESVFAELIGEDPDVPFKDKVTYRLQTERNRWMEKFYSIAFTANSVSSSLGKVIDWQDIHNYNVFINLYGTRFGLRKAAADNDDIALIDPLTKLIISHTLQNKIEELFWKEYTADTLITTLTSTIGAPALPKPEFYDFWLKWIERQKLENTEKDALKEELSEGRLYGKPIEINGKVTWKFALLMLVDMGVLDLKAPLFSRRKARRAQKPRPLPAR